MHISPYFIEFGLFYEINGSNKTRSTPKSFSDEKMILFQIHYHERWQTWDKLTKDRKERVLIEATSSDKCRDID